MRAFINLILGLLISIQSHAIVNDYIFEPITSNTGITFNAINSISDDKYGFIWFGCNNGLYYYNSAEIIKFNFDLSKSNAPQSNIINYIYKDKTQQLWICTENGICYFNEDLNSFSQLKFNDTTHFIAFDVKLLYQLNEDNFVAIINNDLYKFNTKDLNLYKSGKHF